MIYIGIDPGKTGALAYIKEDVVNVMPFNEDIYKFTLSNLSILGAENIRCCVENVGSRPGEAVSRVFNFGKSFGYILGLLEAYHIPYELVTPQKWKKVFSVTADKNTSIAVCKRLFPGVSLLPTALRRKDNDGMAEALLMAEYARRKM